MTETKKASFGKNAKFIDESLSRLSAAFGDAITDVLEALHDKDETVINRDHIIETEHGPIKAYAGIQFRSRGVDPVAADQTTPLRPNETSQTVQTVEESSDRPFAYKLTDSASAWTAIIDLPGTSYHNLNILQEDTVLVITTSCARRYSGRIDIGTPFSLDDAAIAMRNGVLTLEINKGSER